MTKSPQRRPTIVDVAAAAGVSKSLVSLALRGDAGVSTRTRERIKAAADSLGYRSNALARALVQGRSLQIGVVVTDLTNPYHTDVALGVEEAASTRGLGALLAHGRRDPDRLAAQLDAIVSLAVDGVVVVSSRVDPQVLTSCALRLPLVVVGRPESLPAGIDSVSNNDAGGVRQAVEHLSGLGHRRIGFLSSSQRRAARARQEGYEATMAALGLAPARSWHAADPSGVRTAIAELLSSDCTAVVTNNDVTALAVLDAAYDAGREVPATLSVVGYDGSSLGTTVRPRLTSVDQSGTDLGRTAMDMIWERFEGRTQERHAVLEPTLRVRASTGRAPSG